MSSTTVYLSWVTNLFHLTFSFFPIKQCADLLARTSLPNLWFAEVFARAMLVLDAFLLAACSGFILQVSQMLSAVTQAMPKLQGEKGFAMCFAVLARVGYSHFRIHLVENKLQKSEGWHPPRCPPCMGLGSVGAVGTDPRAMVFPWVILHKAGVAVLHSSGGFRARCSIFLSLSPVPCCWFWCLQGVKSVLLWVTVCLWGNGCHSPASPEQHHSTMCA